MSRTTIISSIVCLFCLFITMSTQADEKDIFERIVKITDNKGTIYELLKDLSRQSGYLFVYDSQVIDNNKKIKVPTGEYTLRNAIYLITGNARIRIDLLGEHILLRSSDEPPPDRPVRNPFSTIKGSLSDNDTGKPIHYVSVGILNTTIGTVSNQDGIFQLTLPDSLRQQKVRFSHIGYESMELTLPEDENMDLALKPQVVSLQEI
ncbi:MAG: carboxypeptidase-like regulatory domain-containing protein, partial [Tannerella sp.]|nr:carboxypeptidase-like regulatory domain-containing protein [Tannerella sp.]